MTNTAPAAPVTAADFDYMDAEYAKHIMSDLREFMRLSAMSDAELAAEISEAHGFSGWNECEGKFEINDIGYNDVRLSWMYQIQDKRIEQAELAAARARYMAQPQGLTHRPFAGLVAA